MERILVNVPKNTIPYECGERFMICEAHLDGLKYTIDRCADFYKTREEIDSTFDRDMTHKELKTI